MRVFVTQFGNGQLRVDSPTNLLLRLLGIPFLGIAAYFAYNLVTGIAEYVQHGGVGDWLSAAPGFLMILIFMLFLAAPGFILLFFRKWVLLDSERRQVIDVRDFFLFKWPTYYSLNDFETVVVKQEQGKYRKNLSAEKKFPARKSFNMYPVELQPQNGDEAVLIALPDTEREAKALGMQLAKYLGLELQDKL